MAKKETFKTLAARGSWRAAGRKRGEEAAASLPALPLDPPSHLRGKPARALWRKLGPLLSGSGVVKETDAYAFGALCASWARYQEAERLLDEEGTIVEEKTLSARGVVKSRRVPHPALRIRDRSFEQVLKLQKQFACTPLARLRLVDGMEKPPSAEPEDVGEAKSILRVRPKTS